MSKNYHGVTSHEVQARHIGALLHRQMNWLPDRRPALWPPTIQKYQVDSATASYIAYTMLPTPRLVVDDTYFPRAATCGRPLPPNFSSINLLRSAPQCSCVLLCAPVCSSVLLCAPVCSCGVPWFSLQVLLCATPVFPSQKPTMSLLKSVDSHGSRIQISTCTHYHWILLQSLQSCPMFISFPLLHQCYLLQEMMKVQKLLMVILCQDYGHKRQYKKFFNLDDMYKMKLK